MWPRMDRMQHRQATASASRRADCNLGSSRVVSGRLGSSGVIGRRGKRESETDYNYFDTHLESKLVLSKRALRSIKRQLAP